MRSPSLESGMIVQSSASGWVRAGRGGEMGAGVVVEEVTNWWGQGQDQGRQVVHCSHCGGELFESFRGNC